MGECAVMKRYGLLVVVAAMAMMPTVSLAADATRVHTLPGATAFPESIGADPRTGEFFTGSLIDGSMVRGTRGALQAEPFLPAGTDGRTSVAGVKVDGESWIWVANAFGGRVLVYSEQGRLLHSFVLLGPGSPIINDLAFSRDFVYVTDSARPLLYRLSQAAANQPGVTSVEPWLSVEPPVVYHAGVGPFGNQSERDRRVAGRQDAADQPDQHGHPVASRRCQWHRHPGRHAWHRPPLRGWDAAAWRQPLRGQECGQPAG